MKQRTIIIILYALLMLLGTYLLYAFYQQKKQITHQDILSSQELNTDYQASNSGLPDILLQGITLKSGPADTDDLSWSIKSNECVMYYPQERIFSKNIECFFNYLGHKGYLEATKAYINAQNKELFLTGSITSKAEKTNIKAQNLHYSHQNKTIQTNKPITITRENFLLTAQKMTAHIGKDKRIVLYDVTTKILTGASPDKSG